MNFRFVDICGFIDNHYITLFHIGDNQAILQPVKLILWVEEVITVYIVTI